MHASAPAGHLSARSAGAANEDARKLNVKSVPVPVQATNGHRVLRDLQYLRLEALGAFKHLEL